MAHGLITAPCRETSRAPLARPPTTRTNLTILGLDPGLDRTGYAVIDATRGTILDAGLIRTRPADLLQTRLMELADGLRDVLATYPLRMAAVEELFSHYKHPRTAILMGHARGVLIHAVAQAGLSLVNLGATRVKKLLTGNGHAGKLQVQRAVMATYRLKKMPQPSDVADAIAIAWCAGYLESTKPRRDSVVPVSSLRRRGIVSRRRA